MDKRNNMGPFTCHSSSHEEGMESKDGKDFSKKRKRREEGTMLVKYT